MRAKILFSTVAALAMAGCSQNEITEMNPDANPAIGFGVYTSVQTRGAETTLTTIETPGFGVMALNAGKDAVHMTERQVTKSGANWTYTNTAYWPADKSALNFYAYAPHSSMLASGITTTDFANDATPKIDFTIQTDWSKMVDLVATKKEAILQTTNNGKVTLDFSHILTRVAFTGSTDITGTTVTINELEFPTIENGELYKSGTYNFLTDTWDNLTKTDASYTITGINKELSGTATTLLGGDDKYLFCIPVGGSTGATANKIKIIVKYTMVSGSATSQGTKEVFIPAGHFKKGTAYKYNLKIELDGITFEVASVSSWTKASPENTEL